MYCSKGFTKENIQVTLSPIAETVGEDTKSKLIVFREGVRIFTDRISVPYFDKIEISIDEVIEKDGFCYVSIGLYTVDDGTCPFVGWTAYLQWNIAENSMVDVIKEGAFKDAYFAQDCELKEDYCGVYYWSPLDMSGRHNGDDEIER